MREGQGALYRCDAVKGRGAVGGAGRNLWHSHWQAGEVVQTQDACCLVGQASTLAGRLGLHKYEYIRVSIVNI